MTGNIRRETMRQQRMLAAAMLCALTLLGSSGVRADCDPSACTEYNKFDSDCCGLDWSVGCTGNHRLTFDGGDSETRCAWNAGTCCVPIQDAGTCDETWCSSPTGGETRDCWAGGDGERCTCTRGSARETGAVTDVWGIKYYHYTCCIGGENQGETCGDVAEYLRVQQLMIVIISVCIAASVLGCIACLLAVWWHNRRASPSPERATSSL